MPLDAILIGCYRHDVNYVRTCVASIRFFDPKIPIWLLKDLRYGPFSTRDIERSTGAQVYPLPMRAYGWGFAKLEPLFDRKIGRFLYLDADTLLTGPVLEWLASFSEDFVVSREDPTPAFVRSHYYDVQTLSTLDPEFSPPGYTFNTGQWVGRGGLVPRADFDRFLKWAEPPRPRHPEVFKMGEQGLLNYILTRGAAAKRWTLKAEPFLCVPNTPEGQAIDLAQLARGPESPYRVVVHWCGLRTAEFPQAPRADLLQFFNQRYYASLSCGSLRRGWHRAGRRGLEWRGRLGRWLRSRREPPKP